MENEQIVKFQTQPKNSKCHTCKMALGTPQLIQCLGYKIKPRDVYYGTDNCPKYVESDFDKTTDNDFEDEE